VDTTTVVLLCWFLLSVANCSVWHHSICICICIYL
jgi:hypothetical protein